MQFLTVSVSFFLFLLSRWRFVCNHECLICCSIYAVTHCFFLSLLSSRWRFVCYHVWFICCSIYAVPHCFLLSSFQQMTLRLLSRLFHLLLSLWSSSLFLYLKYLYIILSASFNLSSLLLPVLCIQYFLFLLLFFLFFPVSVSPYLALVALFDLSSLSGGPLWIDMWKGNAAEALHTWSCRAAFTNQSILLLPGAGKSAAPRYLTPPLHATLNIHYVSVSHCLLLRVRYVYNRSDSCRLCLL